MKTMHKSIEITAPKDKVWAVLMEETYIKDWYKSFGQGITAETDWIEGHRVTFTDGSNNGITGIIAEKKPYEKLSFRFDGVVKNNVEDRESDMAKALNGSEETYSLSEENGNTWLSVTCDMPESDYDTMSAAWEVALQRISELAHAV
ncbi:SRPBCC domain-containing protein [Flavobacterium magnum]|uniref:SRPBCC domain-containing protein n=1 Tax=Flavobacterium magnum TaxID=2162713 RepID=A0A2S0RDG8_9FLAO|nr:SRPBCC domain-containing protein [Flavobacterium magnum]AWA29726.1 SRPBCC domain-containing protein [Flavobacterium magnum]